MGTIADIEQKIDELITDIENESTELMTYQTMTEDSLQQVDEDISDVETSIEDLHQTLHDIALNVDNNTAKINTLIHDLDEAGLEQQINTLNNTFDNIDNAITDMDVEHHEELHRLAAGIDYNTEKITQYETIQNTIPDYVIISSADFNNLVNPDATKIYYIYE